MPHRHSSISFRASWNDAHRCAQLCAFNFCASFPLSPKTRLPFSLLLFLFPRSADCTAPPPQPRHAEYRHTSFLFSFPEHVPASIFPDLLPLPNICPPGVCVTKVRRVRSSPPRALSRPRLPDIHPIHRVVWISASILRAPPRKQSLEISLPFSFSPEHVSPRDGFPHPSPGTRGFFTISCRQLALLPPFLLQNVNPTVRTRIRLADLQRPSPADRRLPALGDSYRLRTTR